jgi:hypothetical protein
LGKGCGESCEEINSEKEEEIEKRFRVKRISTILKSRWKGGEMVRAKKNKEDGNCQGRVVM